MTNLVHSNLWDCHSMPIKKQMAHEAVADQFPISRCRPRAMDRKHRGVPLYAVLVGDPVDSSSMPCVEEFRYFSRISIGEWIIGFDKNGKALSKGYSSSPQ
jgi:hypothetical protein